MSSLCKILYNSFRCLCCCFDCCKKSKCGNCCGIWPNCCVCPTEDIVTRSITNGSTGEYAQIKDPDPQIVDIVDSLPAPATNAFITSLRSWLPNVALTVLDNASDIDKHTFVLCNNQSRLGTDIKASLIKTERKHWNKILFIVLQVKAENQLRRRETEKDIRENEDYKEIKYIVDMAYTTDDKIYQCGMNTKAKKKIIEYLHTDIPVESRAQQVENPQDGTNFTTAQQSEDPQDADNSTSAPMAVKTQDGNNFTKAKQPENHQNADNSTSTQMAVNHQDGNNFAKPQQTENPRNANNSTSGQMAVNRQDGDIFTTDQQSDNHQNADFTSDQLAENP